ncbi:MAG: RNase adapter RapZ [Candidatus Hydrogenedentales bacterium]
MTTTVPRFVLLTGLSGAGKSQALHIFEDLGYYCVDNLPVPLVPTFAELLARSESRAPYVAACIDARSGGDVRDLPDYLDRVEQLGYRLDTLFLEASDRVLIQRYSESRRRHPASPTGSIEEGIRKERDLLLPVRQQADLVLDTSALPLSDLKERIADAFLGTERPSQMMVTVLTFGYKFGLPLEADMVIDLRFLPNPHYDPELRPLPGTDPAVRDYVLRQRATEELLRHLTSLLKFLVPRYAAEPKSYFTLALGCTGGRHRSVVIGQEIVRLLRDLKFDARLRHRDLERTTTGAG